MKYCPYCGTELVNGAASFCTECGKNLQEPVEKVVPQKEKKTPQTDEKKLGTKKKQTVKIKKGFGKKQLRESVKVRYSSHTYLKKCVEGIDIGLQGKIHDNQ